MDAPGGELTPRALLGGGPNDYVARRDAAVRAARAAGDAALARRLKALSRPGLALWAALVAGEDGTTVTAAIEATARVAEVQAAGGAPAEVTAATAARRRLLDALVGAGAARLAEHVAVAGPRRAEIAAIVDQLSRRPESMTAWLDGSLRELPDLELGFDAFSAMTVTAPERERSRPEPRGRRPAPVPDSADADAGTDADTDTGPDAAAVREADEWVARADAAEQRSADRVSAAEAEVATRRAALDDAERALARERDAHIAAQRDCESARRARAALDP